MNLELNGRTILLGAMIVLGLCLEALKLWPSSVSAPVKAVAAIEEHLFHSKPYAESDRRLHNMAKAPMAVLPKHVAPVAFDLKGLAEKASAEQSKTAEQAKKVDDAAKDWHWVYNRKLGQWVWKKKSDKKDATKDDTKSVAKTPTIQIPKINGDGSGSDAAAATGVGSGSPATTGYGALASGSGTRFLSQAEWEALLLKSPNSTETKYFAQQYKNHMVTETVFYAIVAEMLKSSNVDMQQQGVLALSLTPSAESFVKLASISTQTTTLQQSVTTALNAYSSTSNLDELKTVLQRNQSNTTVITAALAQLQTAISNSTKGGGTTNPGSQGGTNTSIFQSFVSVLTSLASNNSAVASQAQNILSQLNASSSSIAQN